MEKEELISKIREERLNFRDEHLSLVDGFCCGTAQNLNDYIQGEAFQHNKNHDGNTFLLFKNDTDIIIGYYTLRASSIKLENDYWPVIEISRLAIHQDYQRKGIGRVVILTLINQKIIKVSKLIGVKGILVFADIDAVGFYEDKIGFAKLDKEIIDIIDDGYRDECMAMIAKIDDKFIDESNRAFEFAIENNYIEIVE